MATNSLSASASPITLATFCAGNTSIRKLQPTAQDVDVRSPVPLDIKIALKVGTSTATVNVEAGGDLIETEPTTHTDINRGPIPEAAARKAIVLAELPRDAGVSRRRR